MSADDATSLLLPISGNGAAKVVLQGVELQPASPKLRETEPLVKPYTRGSESVVRKLETNPAGLNQALGEFEADKFAASNVGTVSSRQAWWKRRSEAANIKPYPLDLKRISLAGALLKAGRYRSASAYFSAFRRRHVELDFAWTDRLELAVKDALRSCERGLGPDKQRKAFDLAEVVSLPVVPTKDGWPRFPKETVVFACCEIEAACRIRAQVTFEERRLSCGVVATNLPASKADPTGVGVV